MLGAVGSESCKVKLIRVNSQPSKPVAVSLHVLSPDNITSTQTRQHSVQTSSMICSSDSACLFLDDMPNAHMASVAL